MSGRISSERLAEIIQDVKGTHLSRPCFPKLMIGTGLSLTYEMPGMEKLNDELNSYFDKTSTSASARTKWESIKDIVSAVGLEAGLAQVDDVNDEEFIRQVTFCTAKTMIKAQKSKLRHILETDTGFKRLIGYLTASCSTNRKVIDIMTPNYDLVIELVCDSLGVEVIDGFTGNYVSKFQHQLLRKPDDKLILKNQFRYVRLFKPHGSINWINTDREIVKVNDLDILDSHADKIAIVAPGGDKYRAGMTVNVFRQMREIFNDQIASPIAKSMLVFGYGFNDEHFNATLFEDRDLPLLVLSKDIKEDVRQRLADNRNAVAFYQAENAHYLLYEGQVHRTDVPLWQIDEFANHFIA